MDKPTILVIDDDIDFVRAVKMMLKGFPYYVQSAPDGRRGLEKIRRLKPDLVILDLMLPDRDGFAVCREIKDNAVTSHIPVLMATSMQSYSDERYIKKIARAHLADDYMDKPVSRKDLAAKIDKLMDSKAAASSAANSPSILIVDDDPDFVRSTEKILRSQGYEVLVAETGQEGIKMAKTFLPSLVLLDVMMPDVDGFTTCLEIKKDSRTHNIPVILVTSIADEFIDTDYPKRIAENHQADDFLSKPVGVRELLLVISKMLSP